MADFSKSLSVDGTTRPLYQVTVNDRGSDGGSNFQILVGDFPAALDHTASDTAVQALADAYAAVANYTVVSVTRITVAETVL